MLKALMITWCLVLVAGCGGNSKKSKTGSPSTASNLDLKLSILDKKNEVDLSIPAIPDGQASSESKGSMPDLKLPDSLKLEPEDKEIDLGPVVDSAGKKAPPPTVPWPKGMGPKGSGSGDPLNTDEASQRVQNELDAIARGAEKKAEDAKVDPSDSWQKLVDAIAESGQSQESQMGFYISQSEFTPENRDEAHVANHISVVGGPKPDGTFGYSRVEASWEDWKITQEGYLDGDLWMFLISRDGNLAKFWRYNLVKKTNGTVIKHQGTDITQEMADKKWLEIKEGWIKKLVK